MVLGKLLVQGRPTNLLGGRVVRWSWVNFQCRCVLLSWIIVGQRPTALAVGAGGGCFGHFSLIYHFPPTLVEGDYSNGFVRPSVDTILSPQLLQFSRDLVKFPVIVPMT